jgi:Uma2 family endonuclease
MRPKPIVYPDSDGEPIAEHDLQFDWIVLVEGGLSGLFRHDPNVYVAATLLWYPVEGDPTIPTGPDIMVAFGRPKGHRGSYKQWEEGGIAPQVVFEIVSPQFRIRPIIRKFQFYQKYGVEEFYLYNPDAGFLEGWLRTAGRLKAIPKIAGFISPRLGVRFELGAAPDRLAIIDPEGEPFRPFQELLQLTEIERLHADAAKHSAEAMRGRTEASLRRTAEMTRLADDFERLNDDFERRDPNDFQQTEELDSRYRQLRAHLEAIRARTV